MNISIHKANVNVHAHDDPFFPYLVNNGHVSLF
jgi:hypothetical protein